MTKEELAKIVEEHGKWLRGEGGERANLSDANLLRANLSGVILSGVILSRANLSGANLSGARLSGARLSGANLSDANLSDAKLSGANLSDAKLSYAKLSYANLEGANLSGANLYGANLSGANLEGANLSGANLSGANLSGADLSGATGLLTARDFLAANLGADGVRCYKAVGQTNYPFKSEWKAEEGAYLTETPNPNRTDACGCGVNVATTPGWCRAQYPNQPVWECLIEVADMADIVVPYNSDGKFRAARVKLVRRLETE